MNKRISLTAVLLLLFSCSLAPEYTRPEPPIPAQWPTGEAYIKEGADVASESDWREFIIDKKMQQLIEMAINNNRDLRLAGLNAEMAQAIYGIQKASLYPAVDVMGTYSKTQNSEDLIKPGDPRIKEQYNVNLGVVSWEIDFFGRIRSLKDAALQQYLASEQARLSARLSLISSVANLYLSYAANREILKLANSMLETQQSSYNLIKKRYENGLATRLDLYRAQTLVDTAKVDAIRYTQLDAQLENALNLMAGSTIPKELLPNDLSSIKAPKEISAGLHSMILLKRPDVMAAESMLRASNANIGAARATLFPRITLTALLGTASSELSGLFKSGFGTWAFNPQASMPIFDSRAWAALEAAKIDRELLLTQYEKTIQTAFKETADALAVRGTVQQQIASQESLIRALTETRALANTRYTKGVDNYLSVLDAERSLYSAEQAMVALRLSQLTNLITLYKTLGGGIK